MDVVRCTPRIYTKPKVGPRPDCRKNFERIPTDTNPTGPNRHTAGAWESSILA
jgi:hypothetical protein